MDYENMDGDGLELTPDEQEEFGDLIIDSDDENGYDEVDAPVDEDDDAFDELDDEDDEDFEGDDEDDASLDDEDDLNNSDVKFDKEQQQHVNNVVKKRLERHEDTLSKELAEAAGTEFDLRTEAPQAARLWGLLKENPALSGAIDQVIAQYLQSGQAMAPGSVQPTSKESQLEVREAVLDLKSADKVFNKNSEKIMTWAKAQGYEINNSQSLNLAFLAWKGANSDALNKASTNRQKSKAESKKQVKRQARVQKGKTSRKGRGPVNYAKMSDNDLLRSEGLSLFTDDE